MKELIGKLPTVDECDNLFKVYDIFIEPYCEFITCLYFNIDSYTQLPGQKDTKEILLSIKNFINYIIDLYSIVKNIIEKMSDNEFYNLFLFGEKTEKILNKSKNTSTTSKNTSNISNTSKTVSTTPKKTWYSRIVGNRNNSQNKKITDLCTFYEEADYKGSSLVYVKDDDDVRIRKKDNQSTDVPFYLHIKKLLENIHKNILNESDIIIISTSMFESYQSIRLYYENINKNNNETQKSEFKNIILKYITIIKDSYINNLFRFQFSYLTRYRYRFNRNMCLVISNFLIKIISDKKNINKSINNKNLHEFTDFMLTKNKSLYKKSNNSLVSNFMSTNTIVYFLETPYLIIGVILMCTFVGAIPLAVFDLLNDNGDIRPLKNVLRLEEKKQEKKNIKKKFTNFYEGMDEYYLSIMNKIKEIKNTKSLFKFY